MQKYAMSASGLPSVDSSQSRTARTCGAPRMKMRLSIRKSPCTSEGLPASAGQWAGSHSISDSIASNISVCAARYCELRGISSIENWNFYLAFSFFRLAAIAQGVKKRALSGNASNEKARQVGEMAGVLAKMGIDLI